MQSSPALLHQTRHGREESDVLLLLQVQQHSLQNQIQLTVESQTSFHTILCLSRGQPATKNDSGSSPTSRSQQERYLLHINVSATKDGDSQFNGGNDHVAPLA